MGTDYALACGDCLEFIDLHKWSIVEYFSLPSKRIPSLSTQLLVPVGDRQLLNELDSYIPTQQYIEELLPVVRDFVASHKSHFLFLTCDRGEHPWDFGEPRYLAWKEVQAVFNHSGQFLPRNLIEDFGFSKRTSVLRVFHPLNDLLKKWSEVIEYYEKNES